MSPTTPAGALGMFVLIITVVFAMRAVANLLPPVRNRERKMRGIVLGAPVLAVVIIAGVIALVWPRSTPPQLSVGVSNQVASTNQYVTYVHAVRSIPVLAWHQVDHGCSPAAAVCNAPADDETVSKAQLTAELSYLKMAGYQSVTAGQYAAWVAGQRVALPRKPILLSFDDKTITARWLAKWASERFKLIFIPDPAHNGYLHERYQLEVHGTWSEKVFEAKLRNNLNDGFFDQTR
jgi:hypothetical protein